VYRILTGAYLIPNDDRVYDDTILPGPVQIGISTHRARWTHGVDREMGVMGTCAYERKVLLHQSSLTELL
ncbi:MAG: hypothetical protein M3380_17795, partial [Chloroflexota bacterium]|nr:hypothetical protein [Chloroflexota bacterium]